MRHLGFGIVLGIATITALGAGAPAASACGWLWACDDRRHAHRAVPPAYGYRRPARAYRYRNGGWAYGYTSPRRAYGDPYAAWPSTSIPPSQWYLNTAPAIPDAGEVGLTAPISSGEGLRQGGLPVTGPSLFGPEPVPGYYYSGPAYGYRPFGTPHPNTPSWWLEPRRR